MSSTRPQRRPGERRRPDRASSDPPRARRQPPSRRLGPAAGGAPLRRPVRAERRRPDRTSSAVTATGPRPSAKSRSFGGSTAGSPPLREDGERGERAVARRSTAAILGARHETAPRRRSPPPARERPPDSRTRRTSCPSKTRIDGGWRTGARSRTSASGYSACSRAVPPPVKNDCSVCAARWTTRSPSTRPTQPRSSGCPTGWNMQSRIRARCVPRRPRSPGRRCARAPRSRSPGRARPRASRRLRGRA